MTNTVDVLIPTYGRPAPLAVTLATLIGQTFRDFRVVISDQTEDCDATESNEVRAVIDVLRGHDHSVDVYKHLPRCGMAEQRQFLLDQATAPYVLYIDDDLILEPDAIERMLTALGEDGCGFVGCAVAGWKYIDDVRPHQQHIEFWEGKVEPERVYPGTPEWDRPVIHRAANIIHVARQMGLTPETQRKYKVAWVGGSVMYDTAKLRDCGGFNFWRDLPVEHVGEDVYAQLRVMAKYGGCGLIPTRIYHQVPATTMPVRDVDAPYYLPLDY